MIERLVQAADFRVPVIGPFTFGVGVVHQPHQARARACGSPLEHLQVAVGVAEGEDRPAANHAVDAHRLVGAVIVMGDFGGAQDGRLAVLELVFGDKRGADHLLRRDAIDLLGKYAHKAGIAAGNDVGLEPLAAQVCKHFQHRLVDHLGVGLAGCRVAGLA